MDGSDIVDDDTYPMASAHMGSQVALGLSSYCSQQDCHWVSGVYSH